MPFKTWLPSINQKTGNIIEENPEMEREYQPFLINRALSFDSQCILYANEMNKNCNLPNIMQYDFYYYALPQAKRFNKWIKPEKYEYLEAIKKHYNCSSKKGVEILKVLTDDQIKSILNL